MKATVYFTRELTPQAVVTLYQKLGVQLPGKVAVKVHSGEKGNQNFLRPQFWQPMVEAVHLSLIHIYKKNMFALLGKPGYEAQKAELEAKLR